MRHFLQKFMINIIKSWKNGISVFVSIFKKYLQYTTLHYNHFIRPWFVITVHKMIKVYLCESWKYLKWFLHNTHCWLFLPRFLLFVISFTVVLTLGNLVNIWTSAVCNYVLHPYFLLLKHSIWAPYEQAKTVCEEIR